MDAMVVNIVLLEAIRKLGVRRRKRRRGRDTRSVLSILRATLWRTRSTSRDAHPSVHGISAIAVFSFDIEVAVKPAICIFGNCDGESAYRGRDSDSGKSSRIRFSWRWLSRRCLRVWNGPCGHCIREDVGFGCSCAVEVSEEYAARRPVCFPLHTALRIGRT